MPAYACGVTEKAAEEPRLGRPVIAVSFIALALVYSTMLIGVFLSSQERGIACTEWPLCPNGFGAPEDRYLVEYVHRIVAVTAAAFVYATAVIVPSRVRMAKKAALIGAALVSAQIVLGLLTVLSTLHPIVVAGHLSTGITVFAFGLLTFLWAGVWRKHWR
jgi:cytochrome c oxidase assembly protein subunit 15